MLIICLVKLELEVERGISDSKSGLELLSSSPPEEVFLGGICTGDSLSSSLLFSSSISINDELEAIDINDEVVVARASSFSSLSDVPIGSDRGAMFTEIKLHSEIIIYVQKNCKALE